MTHVSADGHPDHPLVVRSARAVDARGVVDDAWVEVRDGRIAAVGRGDGWAVRAGDAEVVDASGLTLVPGFVDLHVHGGGGRAHEEGADAIVAAVAAHRAHGTTRTVVSLVSDGVEALAERLSTVADLVESRPEILGSHLEGPFLSLVRRGAHDPARLVDPTPAAVDHLLRAARGTLRQITLDPLRPGAEAAIAAFAAAGVVVAVGHTEADHDAARAAFDAGARLLTHAFNAMPGIGHRAPGPVLAAIADPRVVAEVILDGEHVHPGVVALLMGAAPGRVALITDAMAAAAGDDGRYRLGGVEVDVTDGRATLADPASGGSLAGSTLTLDRALRVGTAAGLPLPALVGAMTAVPARVLGLGDSLGLLAPGHAGDLVLLDSALSVVDVRTSGVRVL